MINWKNDIDFHERTLRRSLIQVPIWNSFLWNKELSWNLPSYYFLLLLHEDKTSQYVGSFYLTFSPIMRMRLHCLWFSQEMQLQEKMFQLYFCSYWLWWNIFSAKILFSNCITLKHLSIRPIYKLATVSYYLKASGGPCSLCSLRTLRAASLSLTVFCRANPQSVESWSLCNSLLVAII